jgi:hypothetical protein
MPQNEENALTKKANAVAVAAGRVAFVTAAKERIRKEKEEQDKENKENALLNRKAAADQKAAKRKADGTNPYITRPSASVFA